ncbi:MAG: SDR family oxidoreductase [Pseudomonadota bacterium]
MTLAGKSALVTGGGTGIGLASAQALKSEGARVIVTGRRTDVLEAAAAEYGLEALTMDVTDEASVTEGFGVVGQVDILVANAGIAKGQNILGATTDLWREIMATNLDGAYLTIREALKRMPIDDWGRVIAISSIAGLRGLKGAHAYTASKHGLIGLIRGLSADFAKKPVTFNAICPGYVDTPIIDQNVDHLKDRLNVDDDKALAMMRDLNPHGRLITPQEVAEAVIWLCGPGSGSTSGTAIEISGG